MACSNCNKPSCGCSGTYVVSKTCPPACSEVFNASCIVYTGVDLTCTDAISGLTSTVISRNDYLDTALTAIVNYICARFNPANLPSSVVVSGDDFVVVNASTVGYVTTYTVTLDPAGLPSASIVTAGENVTVTGDGSAGDPYVVNAENAIVISSSDIITVVPQVGVPSTYTTTYDIEVNEENLPDTILESDTGHVYITETQNSPTAGDTTYTLEVDEVTVTAVDDRLTSTLTSPGGAPAFERTFDIAIDDTAMAQWIMNSVVWNTDPLTDTGLIAGAGIAFSFDPVLSQIEISSSFTDPDRWDELSDFAGTTIQPSLPTSTLAFLANPATVDAGGDGISAVLGGIPSAAEIQFTNTDPGSAQLIFGTVAVAGQPDVLATSNTEILTLVEGANIGLVTDNVAKSVTIVNEIDFVFSSVAGDTGVVQAANTVDQVQFVGGESITTTAAGGGPATVTIDFDGVTIGAGLSGSGTSIDPLVNAAPNVDQFIWETIISDSGSTTANSTTDSLTVAGGTGIDTSIVGDTLTIENTGVTTLIAGNGVAVSAATGVVTVSADLVRDDLDGTAPNLPYTGGSGPVLLTHAVGETYVNVRCFNGLVDVTNTTTITMVSSATFTIDSASNITDVLVLG